MAVSRELWDQYRITWELFSQKLDHLQACAEAGDQALGAGQGDNMTFYERYIEELDAITIMADDSAAAVVGICTRAAKRAQMVVDGELPGLSERASVLPSETP